MVSCVQSFLLVPPRGSAVVRGTLSFIGVDAVMPTWRLVP